MQVLLLSQVVKKLALHCSCFLNSYLYEMNSSKSPQTPNIFENHSVGAISDLESLNDAHTIRPSSPGHWDVNEVNLIEEKEREIEKLNHTLSSLRVELRKSQEKCVILEAELVESELKRKTQIKHLMAKIETGDVKLLSGTTKEQRISLYNRVQRENEEFRSEIERLNAVINKKDKSFSKLADEFKTLNAELARRKVILGVQEVENDKLRKEIASIRVSLSKNHDQITFYQKEVKKCKQTNQETQKKSSREFNVLEYYENRMKHVEREMERLRKDCREKKQEIRELWTSADLREQVVEELRNQNRLLKGHIDRSGNLESLVVNAKQDQSISSQKEFYLQKIDQQLQKLTRHLEYGRPRNISVN